MKTCSTCKRELDATLFYKDGKAKDGLKSQCKDCHWNSVRRSRVKRDQDALAEHGRQYARARYARIAAQNREQFREKVRLRKARLMGAPTLPTSESAIRGRWAMWGNICWVCRVAPATETDHVKPLTKGGWHAPCNLRPICKTCNCKKSAKWPFAPEMILTGDA